MQQQKKSQIIIISIVILLVVYGINQFFQSNKQKDRIIKHDMMIGACAKNKASVELELFSKNDICAKSIGVFVSVKEGHPAFYRW